MGSKGLSPTKVLKCSGVGPCRRNVKCGLWHNLILYGNQVLLTWVVTSTEGWSKRNTALAKAYEYLSTECSQLGPMVQLLSQPCEFFPRKQGQTIVCEPQKREHPFWILEQGHCALRDLHYLGFRENNTSLYQKMEVWTLSSTASEGRCCPRA